MLMMAKMMPGVAGQGGGSVGPMISDLFDIQLGTAAALDSLATTGWDLLIAKSRVNSTNWSWRDRVRGFNDTVASNLAGAQSSFTSYDSDLSSGNAVLVRAKRAANFIDVLTYTGDGSGPSRTLSHSLGQPPGMMIIKMLSGSLDWCVRHRSLAATNSIKLNTTGTEASGAGTWTATSTTVTIGGTSNDDYNTAGQSYVVFLFCHDSAADGLIQCGSYTGNGPASGPTITLGWRPQFLIVKNASAGWNWLVVDNLRSAEICTNTTGPEGSFFGSNPFTFNSTGFVVGSSSGAVNGSAQTMIYLAIRAA